VGLLALPNKLKFLTLQKTDKMKKLVLFLIAAIVLMSCSKDEDNNTNNTAPFISAKVDGVQKNYLAPTAEKDTTSGIITIDIHSGYTTTGDMIALLVSKAGSITTGTYNSASSAKVWIPTPGAGAWVTTSNVTVTITAIDATHIEGTFSGTLEPQGVTGNKVVTEGKFYSKFL
jgi:hypothetical protein